MSIATGSCAGRRATRCGCTACSGRSPTPGAAAALGTRPEEPELTAGERDETLALPPRIDSRVAALARQLGEASSPRERVDAVIRHLQTRYRYTLAPGSFHTDDPLAEFLFEKKAGYCEYFASAAVVLLRLQGRAGPLRQGPRGRPAY